MGTGALLVACLSDPEYLIPAAEFLERSEFVECWNAVDGHIDLIANMRAGAERFPDQFRSLAGIEEFQLYNFMEASGTLACNPERSQSILFLEVHSAALNTVKGFLKTFPAIVFSSQIEGRDEMILMVEGGSFQEIDQIVNRTLRTIDGVLRIKQDRIINLKQL